MAIDPALQSRVELNLAADRVRTNRELHKQIPENAAYIPYANGEIAALEWVLGIAARAPVTARAGEDVSDRRELERERWAATDMLYNRSTTHRNGTMYIAGVEETLMWILCETASEPF